MELSTSVGFVCSFVRLIVRVCVARGGGGESHYAKDRPSYTIDDSHQRQCLLMCLSP